MDTCNNATGFTTKGVPITSCEPGSNKTTLIWGNVRYSCVNSTDQTTGTLVVNTGKDGLPCHRIRPGEPDVAGAVIRDSIVADAHPLGTASFFNTLRYKRLTISALLDWRIQGFTSDMTKNTFDEGGNSRDYDETSVDPTQVLGKWRYGTWSNGNIATYI